MKKHILAAALLIIVTTAPAWAQQVRVNHNRTPLRAEPTPTSTALTLYQAGSALDVISLKDGWYKVRDPKTSQEGYILATLVDLLPGKPAPQPVPHTAPQQAPAAALPPPTQPAPQAAAPPAQSPAKPAGLQGPATAPAKPAPTAGQAAPAKPPVKGQATKSRGWTDYAFIGVGAVYQQGSPGFSTEYTFTEYLEQVAVKAEYPAMAGPGFDAGGAVRVWRNLAVGVAVTGATRSSNATVSASIPHPFYFNVGRPIEGSVGVERTEYAAHVHGLWVIPSGNRLLVAIGGGASFFSVRQSLVEGVTYAESYPYDSATFASASVSEASASAVGFGVTADVGYYFSRTIGVGGVVRYAKATVSLPYRSSTLSMDAGGFEAGVGLRVRFRQGKPKPATKLPTAPARPAKK